MRQMRNGSNVQWLCHWMTMMRQTRRGSNVCGDGFECGHHVDWFRVERGGAACTLVLVFVSIRLCDSQ